MVVTLSHISAAAFFPFFFLGCGLEPVRLSVYWQAIAPLSKKFLDAVCHLAVRVFKLNNQAGPPPACPPRHTTGSESRQL